MQQINNFTELLSHVQSLGTRIVAIANAQDQAALSAFAEAKKMGFVQGIFFGDKQAIEEVLQSVAPELAGKVEIVHCPNEFEAVKSAVQAVHSHKADILLKGKVKTGRLLKMILDPEFGLRTGRLLSDALVFENPNRPANRLTIISDGGVTLKPDLKKKIEIIKNAVELAHILGNPAPKVALLSAVETVVPGLQSTADAAVIAKMNQRGQIRGCVIDGPLALDNAVSPASLAMKKIESPVGGDADILIPPDIESANMLAKSTTYWAKYRLGHVIMGAGAPILIPSRADTGDAKLLSIALGCIVCKLGE
ncbi:MAG TPA: bifunctional enoyl-CoA hydratase/phosphate acetyltransferase [Bacteroidetes bacterium]|nr:bifunctional enoyl-CoA hydratase/phosphate acetyltransferase [Bacteroidota bacterium]